MNDFAKSKSQTGMRRGHSSASDELNRPLLSEDEWYLSNAILRQAFDKHPEPGLIFDPFSGIIFRANKAALEFFKVAENDILGRTIGQLYSDERGHLHVFTEEALDRGHAWTRELTLQRPDGKPMRLEHAAVSVSLQGKTRIVLTITDLSSFERRSVDDEANTYHRNGLEE